ncbi:MAG: DUF1592 domain-containing protein [Candidatus Thiodiazotropha sp.]
MTLSPKFLYLSELGTGNGDGWQLSQYEIAAVLAYTYTGTAPDSTLIDLAEEEALSDPNVRYAQAKRLLNTPAASEYLNQFFISLLQILPERLSDKGTLPENIAAAMWDELRLLMPEIILKDKGGLRELYSPGYTFVNKALAVHYGIEASGLDDGMSKVGSQIYGGLINMGAFYATVSEENNTHPIFRARILRENLLCYDLGTPIDFNSEGLRAPKIASTREFWTAVNGPDAANGDCWGCHKYMNDIGFAVDVFGDDGKHREEETRLIDGQEYVYTLLTDGMLNSIDGKNIPITGLTGGSGLAAAYGNSNQAAFCLGEQYLKFTRGGVKNREDIVYLKAVYDRSEQIVEMFAAQARLPSFINRN